VLTHAHPLTVEEHVNAREGAGFAIAEATVQPAGGTVLVADRAIIVLQAAETSPT
jgi:hypothetical protein